MPRPVCVKTTGREIHFKRETRTEYSTLQATSSVKMLTVSLVGKKFSCSIQLQISAESDGGGFELALRAGEKCSSRSQSVSQVTANLNITIQSGCKNRVTKCKEMLMFLQEQAIPKTMNVIKVHMVNSETRHFQRDGLRLFNCIRPAKRERQHVRDRSTSRDRLSSRGYSSDSEHQSKHSIRSRSLESFSSRRSSNMDILGTPRLIRHQLKKAGILQYRKKTREPSLERNSAPAASPLDVSGRSSKLELEMSCEKLKRDRERTYKTRPCSESKLENQRSDGTENDIRDGLLLEVNGYDTEKFTRRQRTRTRRKDVPEVKLSSMGYVAKEHNICVESSNEYELSSTDTISAYEKDQHGLNRKYKERAKAMEECELIEPEIQRQTRSLMEMPSLPSRKYMLDESLGSKSESALLSQSMKPYSCTSLQTEDSFSSCSTLTSSHDVVNDDVTALQAFARRITKGVINSAVKSHMDSTLMDSSSTSSTEFTNDSSGELGTYANAPTQQPVVNFMDKCDQTALAKQKEDRTCQTAMQLEDKDVEEEPMAALGIVTNHDVVVLSTETENTGNTDDVISSSISVATQTELPRDPIIHKLSLTLSRTRSKLDSLGNICPTAKINKLTIKQKNDEDRKLTRNEMLNSSIGEYHDLSSSSSTKTSERLKESSCTETCLQKSDSKKPASPDASSSPSTPSFNPDEPKMEDGLHDSKNYAIKLYDTRKDVKERLFASIAKTSWSKKDCEVTHPNNTAFNVEPLCSLSKCGYCGYDSSFLQLSRTLPSIDHDLFLNLNLEKPSHILDFLSVQTMHIDSAIEPPAREAKQDISGADKASILSKIDEPEQREHESAWTADIGDRLSKGDIVSELISEWTTCNEKRSRELGSTPDISKHSDSWFISFSKAESSTEISSFSKDMAASRILAAESESELKSETRGRPFRQRSSMYRRSISDQNERRRWNAATPVPGACDKVHRPETKSKTYRKTRCVSCPVLSEEDVVLESLESHHQDVCDTLSQRTWVVLRVHELWRNGKPMEALRTCMELTGMTAADCETTDSAVLGGSATDISVTQDNALFLNILQQLPGSCSTWSLSICLLLLPQLKSFISTRRHSSHVDMACNVLHVIVKKVSGVLLRAQKANKEKCDLLKSCISELSDITRRTSEVLLATHGKTRPTGTEDPSALKPVLRELLLAIRTVLNTWTP